jgi:hypothetical protein
LVQPRVECEAAELLSPQIRTVAFG